MQKAASRSHGVVRVRVPTWLGGRFDMQNDKDKGTGTSGT